MELFMTSRKNDIVKLEIAEVGLVVDATKADIEGNVSDSGSASFSSSFSS